MGFLSWLGGMVILVWMLGFVFKIGGSAIHFLLIVAVVVFVLDWLFSKKKIVK